MTSYADRLRKYDAEEIRLDWILRGFIASAVVGMGLLLLGVAISFRLPYDEAVHTAGAWGLAAVCSVPAIYGAFWIVGSAKATRFLRGSSSRP